MSFNRQTPDSVDVDVDVVGGSFYGRYSKISPEKTYNMFISTGGRKEQEQWIIGFPGYKRVAQLAASGSGRGFYYSTRGRFSIAVVGSQVYKVSLTLGKTLIGNISTTNGEVFIAENLNNQICLVDGVKAYIYNYVTLSGLVEQTDGPLGTGDLIPNYVDFHNTFFNFGNANASVGGAPWYSFEYDSPTTIALVSTQALQSKPDVPIAVKHIPGQADSVLVFGNTVTEIQTNIGGLQNYVRNPTRSIDYGCVSVSTIAISDEFVAWLAANEDNAPVIMVYDGDGGSQISTDGIDYTLGQIKHPEDSTANLFRINGHLFYILTFYNSEDDITIAYDFNTKLFVNLSDQDLHYWPASQLVFFNSTIYFLSLNNASIYKLDPKLDVIDENIALPGSSAYDPRLVYDMQRYRITSCIRQKDSGRFIANGIALTLEQGTDPNYSRANEGGTDLYIVKEDLTTIITTEGGVPLIMEGAESGIDNSYLSLYSGTDIIYKPRIDLAISKDGGVTWSNYASRDLHPVGERKNILQWENMGVANDLCFKFRFWGMWRFIVNNAVMEMRN